MKLIEQQSIFLKKMNWKLELKKCLEDKSRAYMIEKYLFKGDLWKGQSKVLDKIIANHTTIVTKSRDVGFTTLMAAYVACELALNSENSSRKLFVYGSFNNQTYDLFKKKVQEFLDLIPNELFIESNTPYLIRRLWKLNTECLEGIISDPDITIIYDEYAYSSGLEFKDIDWPFVKKFIICSTPNHNNLKWYNLVENVVNTSSYVRMEWFENPRHRDGDVEEKNYSGYEGRSERSLTQNPAMARKYAKHIKRFDPDTKLTKDDFRR